MATHEKPLNILWICTDQQRWDTLGCYGNRFVHTPHLDRLAAEGALLEQAFCQNPVCTPSRASFLTGRYPRTARARQNGQDIPASEILITKLLADAGYVCGLAGKLHLSACHPSVCPTMEPRIADGYSEFHWSHDVGKGWPTNEYHTWLEEKGAAFSCRPHPETEWVEFGPEEENHQTTFCSEKAIDFITERGKDRKPWLFSVNIFDPHDSFDPPEAYLARYMDIIDDIPLPNYVDGELENKPLYQRAGHANAYNAKNYLPYDAMTDREHRLCRAAYWAMCDLIDARVGLMLDALERTGQRDNTIVIFMSDHGEMLGDHGIYTKGPFFYEGAVHVPLIISCPGVIQPQRRNELVELVDLPQTVLDILGLPHHAGMQGRSVWPLLSGNADEYRTREDVYCEYYFSMPFFSDPPAQMTMVRTERYKLTVDHNASFGELYDLQDDPDERYNHWDDPAYTAVKTMMLVRLCNRMAWTADPLPARKAMW